jgi:hypothetical protein
MVGIWVAAVSNELHSEKDGSYKSKNGGTSTKRCHHLIVGVIEDT